ncbi:MAG: GNAT family N-acetyltransferase [Lachnospiraceae bacterium]|nr:GNAT family N-acetyltransferase [Lachnospiraceae bacterium]MDY4616097.1 GNAT family N-acetyltransferase [Lachnospiraceae bacterium]
MKLILPDKKYYDSYLSAIEEYKEHEITTYEFLNPAQYDIFQYTEDFRMGNNLPKGWVKATYLWCVDGEEFLGEIAIRHTLTDALLRFGGNIGYGVKYSAWNKGVGTKMLSLALEYARENLSLEKVLITCNDNNASSVRVIEKNGGVLENKIVNVIEGQRRITRRYWIQL